MRMGMSFDGVDDYIQVSNSPSLNPIRITILAWVFPIDWGPSFYPRIVSKESNTTLDQYVLLMDKTSGKFRLVWNKTGAGHDLAAGTVEFNKWQCVAGVMDGSKGYIYKDGVLQGSISTETSIPVTNYNVIIGNNSTNVREFYGLIDEVLIYNRDLSPKEIQLLMKGINIYDGLVLHFDFEKERASEGTNGVRDLSPYGNHGTIYGGARQVPIPNFPPFKRRL
jgi:hypothetical protein